MREHPPLFLKKDEDRRLRQGHAWVYSNEIDSARSPLKAFAPGALVDVHSSADRPLGTAYVNPNTLIAARLLTRTPGQIDQQLFIDRLQAALQLRAALYPDPHYRLVFGESDGLPGLILDRFGEVLVGQSATHGIERLLPEIEASIAAVIKPRALLWRNDGSARGLEGLPLEQRLAWGTLEDPVAVIENGLRFLAAPRAGQKTGWFFDQRDNRARLKRYAPGARVLDVFSYAGGWGLSALHFGATDAVSVDSSERALALVQASAQAAGLAARLRTIRGDAFDTLRELRQAREKFSLVIVDPPAFIKKRRDHKEGALAYRRINEDALKLIEPGGYLVSCSCSHHFPEEELVGAVNAAARHVDRQVQLIERLQQSADHPVLPAIPETSYLKGAVFRVLTV
jgi:23S rRNA (cytosine1962-C5)-methyltransferase